MESIFLMPGLSVAAFVMYMPIIIAVAAALILLLFAWFRFRIWKVDRDLEKMRAESKADDEKFRKVMSEIGSDGDY